MVKKGSNKKMQTELVENKPKKNFFCLEDNIAQSHFHYRNYFLNELRDAFPNFRHMWYVDKYYPTSAHGPLCIDKPIHEVQDAECEKKRKVLKKKGIKLLIVLHDSTEESIMEQLAEFECLGQPTSQN